MDASNSEYLGNCTEAFCQCLEEANIKNLPHLDIKILWTIASLTVIEYGALWYQQKALPEYHENLMSFSYAVFDTLVKLSIRSLEFGCYVWLWKNYALWPCLFNNTFAAFIGTVLAIDFGYYWFHRASHQIMLFWAIHQVHHSSMDLTFPVGLRHSPLQYLFSWVFYLPLALIGLPPTHLMFHLQLNLITQVWVHTTVVNKIGPLEWILNTPSHHRIHHGTRKHVLDTNFGGILIIWDHLFGTFQVETDNEDHIYGIIYLPDYWNILQHQVFYLQATVEKAKSMNKWKDFFFTFIKGPSWQPGLSWCGREGDAPDFDDKLRKTRVPVHTSKTINLYVFAHLLTAVIHLSYIAEENTNTMSIIVPGYHLLIYGALVDFGLIYEGRTFTRLLEEVRCFFGLILTLFFPITPDIIRISLIVVYTISLIMWYSFLCGDKWLAGSWNRKNDKEE